MDVRTLSLITMLYVDLRIQSILDFSKDTDVATFDRVVTAFYTGAGQEVCLPIR